MADNVILRKNEIDQFTENLITYHDDILSGIQEVHRQLNAINNSGDIFHMDRTSSRMKELLDTVNAEVLPLMKNTFGESNECARLLVKIMNGLDS